MHQRLIQCGPRGLCVTISTGAAVAMVTVLAHPVDASLTPREQLCQCAGFTKQLQAQIVRVSAARAARALRS
jgi:hypothetical protein